MHKALPQQRPATSTHSSTLSSAMTAFPSSVLAALLLLFAATSATLHARQDDQPPATFKEALTSGKGKVTLRYRLELVDQDNLAKDAAASTLRTTVSYATKSYRGWSLFVEAENVTATDDDAYRNGGAGSLFNGVLDRPVVADPEITEIDQYWVQYSDHGWTLRGGREGINIDTQRFVGTVGWRQNHQSFDSATLSKKINDQSRVNYTYIANVNRIFGDNQQMGSHLLTGDFKLSDELSLHAFVLDLDYDTAVALSTRTFGVRLFGTKGVTYSLAFATQSDAGDNPNNVDANYYNVELSGTVGGVKLLGGYEVLEGSPGDGKFTTPLATLHKFNGWADQFLATPDDGLEDLYVSLGGSFDPGFAWTVVYHDFQAESSNRSLGSELDAQLTYKTQWGQTFALKAALYDADQHSVDTNKIWFFTTYAFGN